MILFRNVLYPFSLLYGAGVWTRNKLFDRGILKSMQFDIPVIGVGNIRVGGTGKTPCIEWLVEQLSSQYKPAVLSRGYARRTKGFRWVRVDDDASACGDEPLQVKQKFPKVPVAVCEDRLEAVPRMVNESDANAILMDDAFQHRYVKPSFNIMLSSFHRPFFDDDLLPAGRLRERPSAINRADAVIFTKCPEYWHESRRRYSNEVRRYNKDAVIAFAEITYDAPKPLFQATSEPSRDILLVTGIADAAPLRDHLYERHNIIRHYDYPDHYRFMTSDVQNWRNELQRHANVSPVIVTTEKDAARMFELRDALSDLPIYFVPIKMSIVDGEDAFKQALLRSIDALANS